MPILRHWPGPAEKQAGGSYGWQVNRRDLATSGIVGLGGAIGALARHGLDVVWPWRSPGFPWATLTVNLTGSLVIGALLVVLFEGPPRSWWVRPFLAVGLVGGFTTFSAFAVETTRLLDDDAAMRAATYVVASLGIGLIAVWLAATVTRRLVV